MNIQEHLMDCLIEECAEVIKETSKGLRFGLEDRNVLDPSGPTNRERTCLELNDLMAVIDLCVEHGVLPRNWALAEAQMAKKAKVLKFMDYAYRVGALDDSKRNATALEACRAVRAWRDGPEGPEVLFSEGAAMLKKVDEALKP